MKDWKTKIAWLSKDDAANPYSFDVLDCRPAVDALEATIASQPGAPLVDKIVEQSRKNPTTVIPGDLLTAKCAITIAVPDPETLTLLAPGAGHKWELDIIGQRILARRLWTGQIVHVADFQIENDALIFYQLISDKTAVYSDSTFAIAEIQFLLQTYLERKPGAFPIQPGIDLQDHEKIALQGWKAYGPIACFARVADATEK